MTFILFKFLAICLISPLWGNSENMLQEALASYQQGEKATTYEERKLAFNRALSLYSTLEQEVHSPDLNQALADTYFQLGEYPWAILYYQRAWKQNFHNPLLFSHLEQAQKKLGLSPSIPSDQKNGSQPFPILSYPFQFLFGLIFITFLTCSCAIWFPFPWIRTLAISCALLLFLLLSHFLLFHYLTPLEGIVIKTTGFYRAPDWNQPQLTTEPLLAGSKVQVLQMTPEKDWLKIENSSGIIGYIPTDSLRPI